MTRPLWMCQHARPDHWFRLAPLTPPAGPSMISPTKPDGPCARRRGRAWSDRDRSDQPRARERSMIKRFGSLYAGAVDLDDYGYEATPVNDRWLSDEHLATVFEKSEAIAKLMDRTGYSTLWF